MKKRRATCFFHVSNLQIKLRSRFTNFTSKLELPSSNVCPIDVSNIKIQNVPSEMSVAIYQGCEQRKSNKNKTKRHRRVIPLTLLPFVVHLTQNFGHVVENCTAINH